MVALTSLAGFSYSQNRSGATPPSSPLAGSQNPPLGASVVTRAFSADDGPLRPGIQRALAGGRADLASAAGRAGRASGCRTGWRSACGTQTVPAQHPLQFAGPHRAGGPAGAAVPGCPPRPSCRPRRHRTRRRRRRRRPRPSPVIGAPPPPPVPEPAAPPVGIRAARARGVAAAPAGRVTPPGAGRRTARAACARPRRHRSPVWSSPPVPVTAPAPPDPLPGDPPVPVPLTPPVGGIGARVMAELGRAPQPVAVHAARERRKNRPGQHGDERPGVKPRSGSPGPRTEPGQAKHRFIVPAR